VALAEAADSLLKKGEKQGTKRDNEIMKERRK
jgi:hypothetical protein